MFVIRAGYDGALLLFSNIQAINGSTKYVTPTMYVYQNFLCRTLLSLQCSLCRHLFRSLYSAANHVSLPVIYKDVLLYYIGGSLGPETSSDRNQTVVARFELCKKHKVKIDYRDEYEPDIRH